MLIRSWNAYVAHPGVTILKTLENRSPLPNKVLTKQKELAIIPINWQQELQPFRSLIKTAFFFKFHLSNMYASNASYLARNKYAGAYEEWQKLRYRKLEGC